MPNTTAGLAEVYGSEPIKSFGKALRYAMWRDDDYASLIEFENAESPLAFADAVRKFLRRYRSGAYMSPKLRAEADGLRRRNRWDSRLLRQNEIGPRPTDTELEALMKIASADERIKLVTAALISYGLTRRELAREVEEVEKEAS